MTMMISTGPILYSSFGAGETIFLFLLALVVFGPKRLPEIGRQIGKIYGEFRRASNEFKFQIEDELRKSEESQPQKKIEPAPTAQAPQILPPSTGEIVAQGAPVPEREPVQASLPIGESMDDPAAQLAPEEVQR